MKIEMMFIKYTDLLCGVLHFGSFQTPSSEMVD